MIRLNDLARELEVKSREILDCLPRLGITEKKSHSSALTDEEAKKVRDHFSPVAKDRENAAKQQPSYPLGRPIAEIKRAMAEANEKLGAHFSEVAKGRENAAKQQPSYPLGRSIAETKPAAPSSVMPPPRTSPPAASAVRAPGPPAHTNGDSRIDWRIELARLRQMLLDLMWELDESQRTKDSFSARVNRLRYLDKLPPHIAGKIQAVEQFRNAVEYPPRHSLTSSQAAEVQRIWAALTEWADKQGLAVAAKMKTWEARPESP